MKNKLLVLAFLLCFPAITKAQHPCDNPANIPQEATVEINKPISISFCHPETVLITFKWYIDGIRLETVLQPVSGTASPISKYVQYFLNGWVETSIGKRVLELVAIHSDGIESSKSNPLSLTVRQEPPIAPTVISVTQ